MAHLSEFGNKVTFLDKTYNFIRDWYFFTLVCLGILIFSLDFVAGLLDDDNTGAYKSLSVVTVLILIAFNSAKRVSDSSFKVQNKWWVRFSRILIAPFGIFWLGGFFIYLGLGETPSYIVAAWFTGSLFSVFYE